MQKFKESLHNLQPSARRVLQAVLTLGCLLMAAALALILVGRPYRAETHHLFYLAVQLQRAVLALLLFGTILAAALQTR